MDTKYLIGTGLLFGGMVLAPPAGAEPTAYGSPLAAVAAVVAALEARDREALLAVFGPEARDVIFSAEAPRDRDDWLGFLDAYREANRVVVEEDGMTAVLSIGPDQWPFPVPMRRGDDGAWRFDAEAGHEEIVARRVGENELAVLDILAAYVRVQAAYRQTDHDGDGVMEFASAILSDPGERNGLYWPAGEGVPESPIGDFVARATADGYAVDGEAREPEPYFGYYYRVLTEQGPNAPGGARSYLAGEDMVGGHALLAFPAARGETGIMTFMIGENGTIYEADLGESTLEKAAGITTFDPGDEWEVVD